MSQIDHLAMSLIPRDSPTSNIDTSVYKALKSTGNGNCLYNSVSIIINGDESLSGRLREYCASELIANVDLYFNHPHLMKCSEETGISKEVLLHYLLADDALFGRKTKEAFDYEIHHSNENNRWCSILHVLALSTVLQKNIVSLFPNVSALYRPLLHCVAKPFHREYTEFKYVPESTSHIIILWSRDGQLDNDPDVMFSPNHVVPLVPAIKDDDKPRRPMSKKRPISKQGKISTFFKPKAVASQATGVEKDHIDDAEHVRETKNTAFKVQDTTATPVNMKVTSCERQKTITKAEDETQMIVQDTGPTATNMEATLFESETDLPSSTWITPTIGSSPNQPLKKFPKSMFGKQSRSFQSDWFEKWKWLHYDESSDSAFCFLCIRAYTEKKLANACKEKTFISIGFRTWKKAIQKFNEHEHCKTHLEAQDRIVTLPQTVRDVGESLSKQHAKEKQHNRRCFMIILSSIRFLARQGLALRGSEGQSNFQQLLLLRCDDNPLLRDWLLRKGEKYTCADIQNEILDKMSQIVLKQTVKSIQQAKFYTLMADETSDSSNKEQLTICLRWVDCKFEPHEEFIGMYEIQNLKADTIFAAIKDVLLRLNLPVSQIRGQCYDMASAMAGVKSGVAAKIASEEPRAIYTHCYGHALNLACADTIKKCRVMKDAIDMSKEITMLVKDSPRRDALLQSIKASMATQSTTPGIRVFCPTRWTVKADALKSILENYTALLQLWQESLEYVKDSQMIARLHGISLHMKKFSFLFGVSLGERLLKHSDNLSRALQSSTLSAAEGQKMANLTVSTLEKLRTEAHFELFWCETTAKADKEGVETPELPRKKRAPIRFDAGSNPHNANTVKEHYRPMYFEALDLLVNCIKRRFNQPGYQIFMNLENLLINAIKGCSYTEEFKKVVDTYGDDINQYQLNAQLQMLQLQMNEENPSINDVVKFLLEHGNSLFSEITTVLHLLLVIPATNAVSERSFSSLRRVKTYLRTSMTQKRLNSLMILHVHKDKTDNLDLLKVANEFVCDHERRQFIFGKFAD